MKVTGNVFERKGKLLSRVIFIAMGAVVLISAGLTLASGIRFSNMYNEMIREVLRTSSIQLNSEMGYVWDGNWDYDEANGGLMKGGVAVADEYQKILDDLGKQTGLDYTLFWQDTRVITTLKDAKTGERLIGTKASDAVIAGCLKKGEEYYIARTAINGIDYAGYYTPLKNSDGKIVGMIFGGRQRADVIKAISSNILSMVLVALVSVTVIGVFGLLVAKKVSAFMKEVAEGVSELSNGDLNVQVNERILNRKDELGTIGASLEALIKKLGDVITRSKTMSKELNDQGTNLADSANLANDAAGSVSQAVSEIAKGSQEQSNSIQTAAGSTEKIGRNIDDITENVHQLDEYAENMSTACGRAMKAVADLITSSSEVADSVHEIGNTINSTNLSAQEISQFTNAITDIASQTNLLSLNASIEAARAGDAGRGFAVVADEIRELADQSSSSADKIKSVVEKLLADAEASVKVMSTLESSFSRQGQQLEQTRLDVQGTSENAANVSRSSQSISERVKNLESAKAELIGVIEDLSAISEENAAAAQETNASMEELSATFSVINNSALDLQNLASDLENTISYFRD